MKQPKLKTWIVASACIFFMNIGGVSAMKKNSERNCSVLKNDSSLKSFDIQRFGIKCNNLEESNNQILISNFYQNVNNGFMIGWNVSSINAVLHAKYNRFIFNIDQGRLNSSGNNSIPTKAVYRFGIKMEQAYLDNDFMYFGAYGGTGEPYAQLSFYGGYSRKFGRVGQGFGEAYAMIFDEEKSYFSFAASIITKISRHYLTIKPYYSKTLYDKLNLILSDQVYFKNNTNYLVFKLVSGYYPDNNTFINYAHINDRRYRFSCEGLFEIPKYQTTLLPLVGCENVKESDGEFHASWLFQFGIRYTFKNKGYYAEK